MNCGCMPLGGTIGIFATFTGVTDSCPMRSPFGKVTEPACTVSLKPGTSGSVISLSSSPTVTACAVSSFTMYTGAGSGLSAPETVTMLYGSVGHSPSTVVVLPSAISRTGPTGTSVTLKRP